MTYRFRNNEGLAVGGPWDGKTISNYQRNFWVPRHLVTEERIRTREDFLGYYEWRYVDQVWRWHGYDQ
jgi:hypothetical protein